MLFDNGNPPKRMKKKYIKLNDKIEEYTFDYLLYMNCDDELQRNLAEIDFLDKVGMTLGIWVNCD